MLVSRFVAWTAPARNLERAIISLTPQALYVDCEPQSSVESAQAAGAPEEEIEITPEMIKAGILAYVSYDSRFEELEDVVPRVYKAMEAVRNAALAER
jgi:hypothetical protein